MLKSEWQSFWFETKMSSKLKFGVLEMINAPCNKEILYPQSLLAPLVSWPAAKPNVNCLSHPIKTFVIRLHKQVYRMNFIPLATHDLTGCQIHYILTAEILKWHVCQSKDFYLVAPLRWLSPLTF